MAAAQSHRIVFLDRGSLPVPLQRPRCALELIEYPQSQPSQLLERLRHATVAITNKAPLRAAVLERLPGLRLIAVAATGYDCVDVDYCRSHDIAVSNVRDYAVDAVSEHVMALMLALRRNLLAYHALVRSGQWQRSVQFCAYGPPLRDLRGAVLVIVGRGAIGRAVAALATAFGMRVEYARTDERPGAQGIEHRLAELLPQADVLSLHCPLTAVTRGLIDERALRAMKSEALLINTARGGLIDEPALVRALREGWIAGAGIDVLSLEPPRDGNVLLQLDLPNLVVTPHVAWASDQAMRSLADQLSENIDAWAEGQQRNRIA
jgi:glycerate dehydrogenase